MESQVKQTAEEPSNRAEQNKFWNRLKKHMNSRYNWWQSSLLLIATLAICLTAGYYISSKYLWNKNDSELDKQISYYEDQVDKKPNNADKRVQLGYLYFLKGRDDDAIQQFNSAKTLDKSNYEAYLNLAIVYDKENESNKALQMANKAAKLVPNDYKSQLLKGRSYRKLKMYKQAVTALQDAARLKPANTDIVYEIGLVAENQGKKAQAKKIYKEALSYDPTYKPASKALERLKSEK